MKILYINNYKDGTGWAQAGLSNIMALHSTGVDLVCRPITFNDRNLDVPDPVKEMEKKDLKGIDICIQHTLPTMYHYHGHCKNIGYYESENYDFSFSKWGKYINLLDKAWVPSKVTEENSRVSGIDIPISVVPHSINFDFYEKFERTASIEELKNTYNFCFVGELIKRKNIGALLKAFHLEFHPSEPVNLFLKLNKSGYSAEGCLNYFNDFHESLKRGMKIRKNYKEPIVITGEQGYTELLSLMDQCHCFVCSSYGESWCIPALDALALGKRVLYTRYIGVQEFADFEDSVESREVNCIDAVDSISELYTSYDTWLEIDINELRKKMRKAYEERYVFKPDKSKNIAKAYDYKNVGKIMLEKLNEE